MEHLPSHPQEALVHHAPESSSPANTASSFGHGPTCVARARVAGNIHNPQEHNQPLHLKRRGRRRGPLPPLTSSIPLEITTDVSGSSTTFLHREAPRSLRNHGLLNGIEAENQQDRTLSRTVPRRLGAFASCAVVTCYVLRRGSQPVAFGPRQNPILASHYYLH